MKVRDIDGLMRVIYIGGAIVLWDGNKHVMNIRYCEDTNRIIVEREDGSEEIYHTFRNGTEECPDLENYCEGYYEILNNDNAEVEVC